MALQSTQAIAAGRGRCASGSPALARHLAAPAATSQALGELGSRAQGMGAVAPHCRRTLAPPGAAAAGRLPPPAPTCPCSRITAAAGGQRSGLQRQPAARAAAAPRQRRQRLAARADSATAAAPAAAAAAAGVDPDTLKAYLKVQNGSDVRGVALDSNPAEPVTLTPAMMLFIGQVGAGGLGSGGGSGMLVRVAASRPGLH